MTTEEYNGWTNRETWVLNLWINNEEVWYNEVRLQAAEIIESTLDNPWGSTPDEDEQVHQIATWLEEWTEKKVTLPDSITGLVSDLLRSSIWKINYREVASNILLEVSEGVTP